MSLCWRPTDWPLSFLLVSPKQVCLRRSGPLRNISNPIRAAMLKTTSCSAPEGYRISCPIISRLGLQGECVHCCTLSTAPGPALLSTRVGEELILSLSPSQGALQVRSHLPSQLSGKRDTPGWVLSLALFSALMVSLFDLQLPEGCGLISCTDDLAIISARRHTVGKTHRCLNSLTEECYRIELAMALRSSVQGNRVQVDSGLPILGGMGG